ncbi:LacI family DNA-binding transcriptional regulator [Microbacterium sp. ASV49]|uniref:LacI family DNA-binding transcriptional regulator n=1 Tax=Microbacterium candidum TaxID=3041922 RepID=A0ABT7MWE1_9MICO|nr:LacI family DNA-binding transcriptional regulator [Microbacterium sp. ASV49]MDL9978776.1 LacI family DNA-binding transcriptional regulator [Microbacterium sp. ASV49]
MADRVGIAEVAKLAGVHPGTVSRALNPKTEDQVNVDTRARVRRAAKQLGYTANSIARGLRTNSSMTIGIIIPDLTNPIFPPIVRGVESCLTGRGYSAFVVNTDGDAGIERTVFESLLQRQVDGFIFGTGHTGPSVAADAYARGIHAVMVNRDAGGVPYPSAVGMDADGIQAAVRHLHDLGHRSIAHFAGPAAFSTSRVRADAFRAACDSLGLERVIIEAGAYSVEAGKAASAELLAIGPQCPTALVAGNDLLALGAYHSVREAGLVCPDDLSIVGFNDMPFAEDFLPPLTTVRVPLFDLGVEAAQLLLDQLETKTIRNIQVALPVELVVRGSTAVPRR